MVVLRPRTVRSTMHAASVPARGTSGRGRGGGRGRGRDVRGGGGGGGGRGGRGQGGGGQRGGGQGAAAVRGVAGAARRPAGRGAGRLPRARVTATNDFVVSALQGLWPDRDDATATTVIAHWLPHPISSRQLRQPDDLYRLHLARIRRRVNRTLRRLLRERIPRERAEELAAESSDQVITMAPDRRPRGNAVPPIPQRPVVRQARLPAPAPRGAHYVARPRRN